MERAKITLDSIQFTPEGTTIVALADPITNGSAVSKPALATTPPPSSHHKAHPLLRLRLGSWTGTEALPSLGPSTD